MAAAAKRERKLKGNVGTYRDLLKLDIPTRRRTRVARTDVDKLYPIRITETSQHRVKVHYIGYSTRYDEWKDASEVEDITPTNTTVLLLLRHQEVQNSHQPWFTVRIRFMKI